MNPGDKPVLTFTVTASDATDPPTIGCTPDSLTVTDPNSLIELVLVTPGYSFDPERPIVFKTATTDFPDLWTISPTQITMRDRCSVLATLPFTINVVESSGQQRRLSLDPSIQNEPD